MTDDLEGFDKQADEARAAEDLTLWKQWDQTGRKPQQLRPLLKRFEPMIMDRSRVYTGKDLSVPPAAIEAEHKKQFLKALETYDPHKGTLGTHVYGSLRAASRFVTTHQNFARIPETRIFNIGEMNRAVAVLDAKNDRPPTPSETAKYLKWRVSDVVRLQREMRKDLRASKFPMELHVHQPSKVPQAIGFVQKELEPRDRKVLTGIMQHEKIRETAARLHMSPSAVSRSKVRIAKKLKRYLDGRNA